MLPESFWTPNEYGVRTGMETGFMSTTTSREVAVGYTYEGKTPMVFEFEQGMIHRGAELDWLSQYPHEKEGAYERPTSAVPLARVS